MKSRLIRKDPDAGEDLRQEEKGTKEGEMVGWHGRLNGHELEQAPGDGERQGSPACCSPGAAESDMLTELRKASFLFFSPMGMIKSSHLAGVSWRLRDTRHCPWSGVQSRHSKCPREGKRITKVFLEQTQGPHILLLPSLLSWASKSITLPTTGTAQVSLRLLQTAENNYQMGSGDHSIIVTCLQLCSKINF